MLFKQSLLSSAEKSDIVKAIESAECATSGEIKIHVEAKCSVDAMDRAAQLFTQLLMHRTELRNGVLIYVALKDKKFAIIGDEGINEKVDAHFWESTAEHMKAHFKNGHMVAGICAGISEAGTQLATFFPYTKNDKNELDNEISFS